MLGSTPIIRSIKIISYLCFPHRVKHLWFSILLSFQIWSFSHVSCAHCYFIAVSWLVLDVENCIKSCEPSGWSFLLRIPTYLCYFELDRKGKLVLYYVVFPLDHCHSVIRVYGIYTSWHNEIKVSSAWAINNRGGVGILGMLALIWLPGRKSANGLLCFLASSEGRIETPMWLCTIISREMIVNKTSK